MNRISIRGVGTAAAAVAATALAVGAQVPAADAQEPSTHASSASSLTLDLLLTTNNTAIVFWPSPSTGFHLQQNTNITTTNWVAAPQGVTDNGTIKYITINPTSGKLFYRLINP